MLKGRAIYKKKREYVDKHKCGLDIITASPELQLLEERKNQEASTFFCTTIAWHALIGIWSRAINDITRGKKTEISIWKIFGPLISEVHHTLLSIGIQPNLFRLLEALSIAIARIQKSKEDVLNKYNQCGKTKIKGDLGDCSYLDKFICGHIERKNGELQQNHCVVVTMDSAEEVCNRSLLFLGVLEQFNKEIAAWLLPPSYDSILICLGKHNGKFIVKDTISSRDLRK